jgi:hypothetical protein
MSRKSPCPEPAPRLKSTVPRALFPVLLLAGLAAGCQSMRVREIEKPVAEATLMVARGADEATVSWQSQRGLRYAVLFSESRGAGARWQHLPGASGIPGTGATLTIRDAVPAGTPRFYRLEFTPVSGRRP